MRGNSNQEIMNKIDMIRDNSIIREVEEHKDNQQTIGHQIIEGQ